jgi:predicted DNA-binding transcriptional regulator YafY
MRRADRLFEILQILRRKKTARAADIADELEVAVRTVYRDIADLMAQGVPIEGEAGIGYILRAGFDLPPLMFDDTEIEALLLGARIVQSWADPELARSAADVIAKVRAVLPDDQRPRIDALTLWAPADHAREAVTIDQAALRRAIRARRKVAFRYSAVSGKSSKRLVRPLLLAFYGPVWLLAAWDEARKDFRVFRLDRMSDMAVREETFRAERGKSAPDFLRIDASKRNAGRRGADGAPA